MKGLDIGNKRLKHNIVDLFPGTQTDPDRQMKPSRWMHVHTHTRTSTHIQTLLQTKTPFLGTWEYLSFQQNFKLALSVVNSVGHCGFSKPNQYDESDGVTY